MSMPRLAVGRSLAPMQKPVQYPEQSAGTSVFSNDEFDAAMGNFSAAYADQTERDHAALKAAVRKGKITACQG